MDDRSTWLLAITLLVLSIVGLWLSEHPEIVRAISMWMNGD